MNAPQPVLSAREVIRALEKDGFEQLRQRGSHRVFWHSGRAHLRVVIPDHVGRDLKTGTLKKILEQAEMTVDRLRDLL